MQEREAEESYLAIVPGLRPTEYYTTGRRRGPETTATGWYRNQDREPQCWVNVINLIPEGVDVQASELVSLARIITYRAASSIGKRCRRVETREGVRVDE